MVGNMFNGMFGKIAPNMCKLAMDGGIAVKTSNGYKKYNLKTSRLVNCDSFVFPTPDNMEMFFVIPTNKVKRGDIILVNGTPRCVTAVNKDTISVVNYENSTAETVIPERHIFMGNTYFYGKIVSLFGGDMLKGKDGMNNIMKYMIMSEMMKGSAGGDNGMSAMLPLMVMNGGMGDMFSGMFDAFDGADIDLDTDNTDNEEE